MSSGREEKNPEPSLTIPRGRAACCTTRHFICIVYLAHYARITLRLRGSQRMSRTFLAEPGQSR